KGRSVSTWIRNNMNDREETAEKTCGLCRKTGHTRRTCTALAGGASSSGKYHSR
ncbi:hypothetical protein PIB30_109736, partial [Stylosanthes scabra]|nr:hypothetical protein [Stylosanthes scabra]